MAHNLKIIDVTIRQINKQIKDLYQHTSPRVQFYFDIVGTNTIFGDDYLITICYRIPSNYGIPTEILAELNPKEISFDNFIVVMKELFAKWKIPIMARSFSDDEFAQLKSNFNDALRIIEKE